MKIIVHHDDGTETDVTLAVKVCYDVVRGSLDWGSGFLDTEETDSVVLLAKSCGFEDYEAALASAAAWRRGLVIEGPSSQDSRIQALRKIIEQKEQAL